MRSFLPYTKKYRKEIILGPIFKFLEAVFELMLPLFMAKLIDNGIRANNRTVTLQMAGIMLLMSFIGLGCVLTCQYYASIASQGFGTELRNDVMRRINRFSHAEINHFGTSTLITRVTNDINQLQYALAMLIRLAIRAPFLSIGSIFMAFTIRPQITWVFLLTLPIFSLLLMLIMKRTVPLYKRVQIKIDKLNLVISEHLSGVRIIRAFAKKQTEAAKVAKTSDELAEAYTRVANISALLTPATTLIMNSVIILILYLGGIDVDTGAVGQGDVLALVNYMTQMLLALIIVSQLVIVFTRAFASAGRINEILKTEPSVVDSGDSATASWQQTPAIVTFKQVDFRYTPKSGRALTDISFQLKTGEFMGIIGPTGSGKTTLMQLIPRFYDISAGELLIHQQPITNYSLNELRRHIATVPQTSVLFSGTIRSNLQWGKPHATDEECWHALDIAQCTEFVKGLPQQLDAPVLAGGKNFSGGQKQRLTIARALIKQPALLILDDSLSALDYQTDLNLRNALRKNMAGTTIIVISQRISSVQGADNILVLNDGGQDGFASHDVLMQTSKTYRSIAESQLNNKEATIHA